MRVLSHPRGVPAVGVLRRATGFTLVELMITIGVAAILLMIAVPSFNNLINSNRLTTAANEIIGALQTARMEAIKRNADTQFCSNSATNNNTDTLGTACGTNGGAVYVQTGPATASTVLVAVPGLTTPVQLSGNITAIRFTSQGLGYKATLSSASLYGGKVADICTKALSSNNHIVINMTTGSTLAAATPTTGTCP